MQKFSKKLKIADNNSQFLKYKILMGKLFHELEISKQNKQSLKIKARIILTYSLCSSEMFASFSDH